MRGLAAVIRSAPRRLSPAAVKVVLGLALAVTAALPARAQSAYGGYNNPEVIVDLGVLDQLGPAPTVPDGRFVLHPPRATAADQSWSGQKIVLRSPGGPRVAQSQAGPRRVGENRVQRIGNVTIDYSALPPAGPRLASAGPRIVLHLPAAPAETVAAAVPPSRPAPQGPADAAVKPPVGNAIAAAPPAAPLPSPAPPATPSMPQVAALPPLISGFSRLMPAAGPPDTPAPEPGAALAATPPATAVTIPKSDDGAVRFAPGAADLGNDARFVLDALAQKLSAQPNRRIQLVAYASAPGSGTNDAIEARRTSLARAVVVRAYLIQRGVSSARIDVRALGNRAEGGGSLDRVDLVMLGS